MTGNARESQIAAIVLAAGGSARMGQSKQLLPINGQPMVRRVTATVCAANLAQVVVVTGAQAEAVKKALAGLPAEIVVNEAWAEGLSSSLRLGLRALRPEIQAALMVLADQPALTPELLNTLAKRYRATGAAIVLPVYQGRRGNPVLFDRALFADLLAVEGDQGGRAILACYASSIERVEVDDPSVLLDIDTRADYDKVREGGIEP